MTGEDGPRGLFLGDSALEYVQELRETWPCRQDDEKRRLQPENGDFRKTMKSKPQESSTDSLGDRLLGQLSLPSGRTMLVVLMALSVFAVAPASAETVDRPNYASDNVDEKYIYEKQIDVDTHDRGEMSSLKQYYDDNGDVQTLPVEFNESIDHRVGVHFDKVNSDAWTQFPRDKDYSAINASHWTVGGTNSSAFSVVERDGQPAENVEAIGFTTDGSLGSGAQANATFTDVAITSDAAKRTPFMGLNIGTLETGTELRIQFKDADGDYKEFIVNSSADPSNAHVIANATGTGYFTQERLENVATSGSGDGTFSEIQSVEVVVVDGDVDATMYALDTERKSLVDLGTQLKDTDDDDELEEVEVEDVEQSGHVRLVDLSSMDSTFDSAKVNDLSVFGLKWTAEKLEDSDRYNYTADTADSYAGYEHKLESTERLRVIQAIDLSHHGLELRVEQANVGERYKTTQYAEGSSSDLSDVSSWSSFSMGGEGETIVVDDTVQPGTNYDLNMVVVYQDSEFDSVLGNSDGEGGTGDGTKSAGGYGSIPLIGGVLVGLLGLFRKITGE